MSYSKILITGATGFIGTRLCEKLTLQHRMPFRAIVRNFSKAARIARLNAEMVPGDLSDRASLERALVGCDAVVHLGFGSARTAERNLLVACKNASVSRFVHMSSMAVHGPNPGPECASEATATIGYYGEAYSDAKVAAERTIQRAMDAGYPGIILRPGIVYGPYSPFVLNVVREAKNGYVSLLDDGVGICNAVFVDDVCDAIISALTRDGALGRAFFVTGDHAVSWREFNLTFANMVSPSPQIVNFSSCDIREGLHAARPTVSSNIKAFGRLMANSDFHDQLETVPALRSSIRWSKRNLKKILPANGLASLRRAGEASNQAGRATPTTCPDAGRLVREDFQLEFSNELAKQEMGWKPGFDFARGARVTGKWLEFAGLTTSS
jgi:nucleoside-diphosphate-sugar epimerase